MPLTPGMKGQATLTVDQSHSAKAFGVGTIPVLGLPALVALIERAAVNATRPHLDEGRDSVGTMVNLRQKVPVGLGKFIRAEAVVTAVDGDRVTLAVTVRDSRETIAEGTLERAVVDREQFIWGAAGRGL
jgi:predicted thioesterase